MSIGRRLIGKGHPVYVIAEAGVNHNGDIATARKLIEAAHDAGADAVKFQLFSADRLVAASAPSCGYQARHDKQATTQRDMLRRLELDSAAFRDLRAYAGQFPIDFLATPFGLAELDVLVDLGVPAIKIASSDLVNVPLLAAAAATDLPLIVSTGAAEAAEIDQAVRLVLEGAGKVEKSKSQKVEKSESRISDPQSPILDPQSPTSLHPSSFILHPSPSSPRRRLILLHCVSAYPTEPDEANLSCIRTLAERFHVPVGFSDHTPDPTFSGLAVAAGAVILEKHLTLDHEDQGPDHFFSLLPEQLARYVAAARVAHAALGDGALRPAEKEREVRKLARGSIVTTVAIGAGQSLAADLLTIQRPGDGIDPARWHDLVGRVAREDIPPNTRLCWSMIR